MSTFDIYAHPVVIELMSQLDRLVKTLDGFETTKKEFDAKYNAVKSDKEEYLKSVNEKIMGFDQEMRIFDKQRREIEQQMWSARDLKDQIMAQIDAVRVEEEAKLNMEQIEKRWAEIQSAWDFSWLEAIRKFQMDALRFTVDAFEKDLHGVLIADQMGLGKTLEAGASIDVIQGLDSYLTVVASRCPSLDVTALESRTVLWLCPTSIKEATVRELTKWGRANTIKLQGSPEIRKNIVQICQSNGMILVVGYEQLRDRKGKPITPELFEHEWPIVVLDEAHRFKNDQSSTFERVETLCKNAGFIIPMTGTPIMNKPEELWAILHMLTLKGKYEGKFQHKWRFVQEYCQSWGTQQEFRWGAYDELISNISDMVIRRRKDEVFEDMPDKVREVRFVQLGEAQRRVYDQMRDNFLIWLDEQKTDYVAAGSIIAQLTRLRQLALYPAGVKFASPLTGYETVVDCNESAKLDEAMEILEELLQNDEKCLVFSNYNEPLRELQHRIDSKVASGEWTFKGGKADTTLIMGGQTDLSRANKVDRFNDPEDHLAVICGNIGAMGIGLNLQGACSNAIFLDLGWNPGVNEQAEDRLHRQGQKNAVTIHIIQGEDTVDAFIADKLEKKANMIEGVMERSELRKAIQDGLI